MRETLFGGLGILRVGGVKGLSEKGEAAAAVAASLFCIKKGRAAQVGRSGSNSINTDKVSIIKFSYSSRNDLCAHGELRCAFNMDISRV
jgi:hypothetical protein